MNVKELKKILEDIPDDFNIIIHTPEPWNREDYECDDPWEIEKIEVGKSNIFIITDREPLIFS